MSNFSNNEQKFDLSSIEEELDKLKVLAENITSTSFSAFNSLTRTYANARHIETKLIELLKEANAPLQELINQNRKVSHVFLDPLSKIAATCDEKGREYLLMTGKQSVEGDGAVCSLHERLGFELINIADVPAKYLQLNEEAVANALRMGVRAIPGVRVIVEEVYGMRVKKGAETLPSDLDLMSNNKE